MSLGPLSACDAQVVSARGWRGRPHGACAGGRGWLELRLVARAGRCGCAGPGRGGRGRRRSGDQRLSRYLKPRPSPPTAPPPTHHQRPGGRPSSARPAARQWLNSNGRWEVSTPGGKDQASGRSERQGLGDLLAPHLKMTYSLSATRAQPPPGGPPRPSTRWTAPQPVHPVHNKVLPRTQCPCTPGVQGAGRDTEQAARRAWFGLYV